MTIMNSCSNGSCSYLLTETSSPLQSPPRILLMVPPGHFSGPLMVCHRVFCWACHSSAGGCGSTHLPLPFRHLCWGFPSETACVSTCDGLVCQLFRFHSLLLLSVRPDRLPWGLIACGFARCAFPYCSGISSPLRG